MIQMIKHGKSCQPNGVHKWKKGFLCRNKMQGKNTQTVDECITTNLYITILRRLLSLLQCKKKRNMLLMSPQNEYSCEYYKLFNVFILFFSGKNNLYPGFKREIRTERKDCETMTTMSLRLYYYWKEIVQLKFCQIQITPNIGKKKWLP